MLRHIGRLLIKRLRRVITIKADIFIDNKQNNQSKKQGLELLKKKKIINKQEITKMNVFD